MVRLPAFSRQSHQLVPGGMNVSYKRKGEQRMMPKLGAYTTGNMELSSIGVSMETIPSVIG